MQGILKSNHQRLCDCLQDIKSMQLAPDHTLNDMEAELQAVFLSYQEKMRELKRLVVAYEEKQKAIKNEIKRIKKRNNLPDTKKTGSLALDKVLVLILLVMHQIFIEMVSEAAFNSFFQL